MVERTKEKRQEDVQKEYENSTKKKTQEGKKH
jgi:hypothetical protein